MRGAFGGVVTEVPIKADFHHADFTLESILHTCMRGANLAGAVSENSNSDGSDLSGENTIGTYGALYSRAPTAMMPVEWVQTTEHRKNRKQGLTMACGPIFVA